MPFSSFLSRHLRRHGAGGATKRRTRLPGSQNAKTRPCRVEPLEPRLLLSFSDWIADASNPFPGETSVLPRWIDYNNDGWTDAVTNGFLWRNDLATTGEFTRVTTQDDNVYPADFDNDGWTDLIAVSGRGSSVEVLRNVDGTGAFQSIANTPIGDTIESQGASVGDFNDDGYVDIYIGGYEIWPHTSFPDKLVLNVPVTPTATNPHGRGFVHAWTQSDLLRARGITSADWNEDGRLDVYVSNYRLQPNLLWVNNGNGSNFPFDNGASTYNADGDSGHSIGSAWGDMDSDGLIDLLAGNFAHEDQPEPHILLNQGPNQNYAFHDRHREGETGIPYVESYASPSFGDFDNDGMLDLLYTALVSSYGDNNVLMRNVGTQGNPFFADVTGAMGLPTSGWGDYQVTWSDIDNDGDLDLGAAGRLWRNDTVNNNNWLKVQLRGNGTTVDGSAIGAQVRVTAGDLIVTRQVESGTGQGQVNDLTLHFGLGTYSGSLDVEVFWPDGTVRTVHANPNQSIRIPYNLTVVGGADIGEVGTVVVTDVSQTVNLNRVYENPVVFAQSASTNGQQPVVVRVNNVQADRFDMFLAEPSNLDGGHGGETVTYVVLEAGIHTLQDGTQLEVGTVNTSATVGRHADNTWETVNFTTDFPVPPVVLSQIQTKSESGQNYLQTRNPSTIRSAVVLALEQEEAITTQHGSETIGYLAIEHGEGTWNNMAFQAGSTSLVVSADFTQHTYATPFGSTPSLLSSLTSYFGKDNAHVRYSAAGATSVNFKVEEDTTFDTEIAHTAEIVSFLAIEGEGMLTAREPQMAVGEVGTINDLTDVPRVVVLDRAYDNPVVFAQSVSTLGQAPTIVRVTDVQSDRFTLFLVEPSDKDGTHIEEVVSYVVLEAGMHQLIDGTRVEVGTLDTSATVGRLMGNLWESVQFSSPFAETPVVLSQIQTTNDAGMDFLKIRHLSTDANGTTLALEPEEVVDTQLSTVETIGYLAIEEGFGLWGELNFEAGLTPTTVTDQWTDVSFSQFYSSAPAFLSSMNTYAGQDNGAIRYTNLSDSSVQLKVDEDTTFDTEVTHSGESVAFLAIGGQGTLMASRPLIDIGEVGQIDDLTNEPRTVLLNGDYENPVVFAQSGSGNGGQPISVRVRNVQSNQFEIYLAEPSNEDGTHGAEMVSYLVLEAGVHRLHDDTVLEVGTLNTSATVGKNLANVWETVNFSNTFSDDPVVLSQIQTVAAGGARYLNTRYQSVSPSSVVLALEPEEAATDQHDAETVGYLAIDSGSGVWSGLVYKAKTTASVVDDSYYGLSFESFFSDTPAFLSNMSSYNGQDNANLRYTNLTTIGVQVRAGEDTTVDTELIHGGESVSYFAIGGSGSGQITAVMPQIPPRVTSIVRDYGDDAYDELDTLQYTFDEEVTITSSALQLTNDSAGGTAVSLSGVSFSYDAGSLTASWDFSGLTPLPAAWYTATLDATKVTDAGGLLLDGDGDGTGGDSHTHSFLVAERGDADLDGYIDISDFNTLTQNFDPLGLSGVNDWSRADFDGDGDVDVRDFNALVRNFSPLGYATLPSLHASSTASIGLADEGPRASASVLRLASSDDLTTPVDRAFEALGQDIDESLVLAEFSDRRRLHISRNHDNFRYR